MKNVREIKTALMNELTHWMHKQAQNPFERYYLYYSAATPEHTGGLIIVRDAPKNSDYQLVTSTHINRAISVEANFYVLMPQLMRLPLLSLC